MKTHAKDKLFDAIVKSLFENTDCKEPFLLLINPVEYHHRTYRKIGEIGEGYDG